LIGLRERRVPVFVLLALSSCVHGARPTAVPESAEAVAPGTLINAFTDNGTPQRFRIDSVDRDPLDRDGDVRLYGLSLFDPRSQTWQPYCLPDAEGRRAAIPVAGSWAASGTLESGKSDAITFACTSGAIAKCIRLGYKPWRERNGVPLAPYHAACVRMVRADYCGNGRTHTQDGTRIDIWDPLGVQIRDQPRGEPEIFEAAWSPTGAAYLNVPRWSDQVAEIVKECPQRFAGRTSRDRPLTAPQVQQQFPDALLFNARFVRSQDRRAPP
jgi:hypothetical protein